MRAGRIHRNARRGVVALVVGWAVVMVGSLFVAPSAVAGTAPDVTVLIRDLTPPLVSVDKGGTVAFLDQIQDKDVQVGGGGLLPSLVEATVHTDVTLQLPSGKHVLTAVPDNDTDPTHGVVEKFDSSCLTCSITYTYRVTFADTSITGSLLNTLTGKALAGLPQNQVVTYNGKQTTVTIGVPTPFIVNTLVPLPNLPSVNLPSKIQVTVPSPAGAPNLGGTVGGLTQTLTTTTTTTTTTRQGIAGAQYQYLGVGVPQMSPAGNAASSAVKQVQSLTGSGTAAGGSGGTQLGAYDTTPVFALDGTNLKNADASSAVTRPQSRPLSVPALLAVVVLLAAAAGLVLIQRARRAAERDR